MSKAVTEASQKVHDAEKARRDYERKTAHLKEELEMSRRDGLYELKRIENEAKAALRDARDAALKTHKWEGKKVSRTYMRSTSRWSTREVAKTDFGIVETVSSKSRFPGNFADYNIPSVGTVIVREIKADGTPSLRFHGKLDDDWSPVP